MYVLKSDRCLCLFFTVKECVENLSREDDKENLVASLWGAERCLRVLESVGLPLLLSQDSIFFSGLLKY